MAVEGMPNVFGKGRTDDGLTCIIIEQVLSVIFGSVSAVGSNFFVCAGINLWSRP